MVDRDDNIWICANQEDEIVVVDKTGKVIAKLGDFGGIDPQGIARGLLTPGKFGLQSRRQVALRLELHPFPAVPQAVPPRESSVACNRLGLDVASPRLHRVCASGQDPAVPGGLVVFVD
jgi:hypothetical protein